jgi:hypothetical protein
MVTDDPVRRLALSLPEATEQDHHGMASFRVRHKIFATVPDPDHIRIMVDESEILAVVSAYPGVCEPRYWGKRLACVVVSTHDAPSQLLQDLLTEAWLRKAPKHLAERLRQSGRLD